MSGSGVRFTLQSRLVVLTYMLIRIARFCSMIIRVEHIPQMEGYSKLNTP